MSCCNTKALEIIVGKFYKTRNGLKVCILHISQRIDGPYVVIGEARAADGHWFLTTWNTSGQHKNNVTLSDLDLVAEWIDPPSDIWCNIHQNVASGLGNTGSLYDNEITARINADSREAKFIGAHYRLVQEE